MRKIICLCLIALLSQSCNDMLEEEVVSGVADSYLNTVKGFEDAARASYTGLRSFYATERGMTLTVFGTDTYRMGADGSFKFFNLYDSQFDARAAPTRELWNDLYIAINSCNAVIDRADAVEGLDPVVKTTRVAEARFLRAHYYFILTQLFGRIHLSLNEVVAATNTASRSPVAEVYNVIISDLEFAIANLPATQADYGRATKPASQHLLARVLLTRATTQDENTAVSPNPAADYQRAATLADSVINNYTFNLLPDFAKVFEQGSGEINNEVIWSVQYTSDPRTNGGGNNAHVFFLMEYDVQAGMQRDVQNGRPFKRFRPTDYLLNTVFRDRLNDTRYEKSFKPAFLSNKPGTYNAAFDKSEPTLTFASGDSTIWLPGYNPDDTNLLIYGPKLTQAQMDAKPYQVLTPNRYTPGLFPALVKYLDPLRPDRTTFEGSRDFLAFRLAETYLIAAEAYMMLGQTTPAADRINVVRLRSARVGATPEETAAYQAAMTASPAQMNIDFILEERARELLGEQFRWFDLVRLGKLVERVRLYNLDAAPNIQEFHKLRPIPQDQIDRTEGNAAAFPQNPGY